MAASEVSVWEGRGALALKPSDAARWLVLSEPGSISIAYECIGRHQNHEEDLRTLLAMPGVA